MFGNTIQSGLTIPKILGGINKSLNIANQLMPLVKEAKPVIQNMKKAWLVLQEFKPQKESENKDQKKTVNQIKLSSLNKPVFFQ